MSRKVVATAAIFLFVLTFAFSFSMVSHEIKATECWPCNCVYTCECSGLQFQGRIVNGNCIHFPCQAVNCVDPCRWPC